MCHLVEHSHQIGDRYDSSRAPIGGLPDLTKHVRVLHPPAHHVHRTKGRCSARQQVHCLRSPEPCFDKSALWMYAGKVGELLPRWHGSHEEEKGTQDDSDGEQIVPAAVRDIEAGGDREAFARGPAASPMNQGYSYHHQWWMTHNEHNAYHSLGYGGQMLYIAPAAHLVIAKFSSYPTPTPAGNEFYAMMAAFPALAQALTT